MKSPIQNINNDFDDDYFETEEYLQTYYEDEMREEHESTCQSCSGTGEGTYSGGSCVWCNGKGYVKRKH